MEQRDQDYTDVLVIEADETTAHAIEATLRDKRVGKTALRLRRATTVCEAWEAVAAQTPDVIVLDLDLTEADGLLLCSDLTRRVDAPLLAHGTERRDRILSLRLGADDAVALPLAPDEREAFAERVTALLRRARSGYPFGGARPPVRERLGELVVDRLLSRATFRRRDLRLTPSEFRLLSALMTCVDQPVTRAQLAAAVGDPVDLPSSRALDMHIRRLRAKLDQYPGCPAIVALRGVGYRLVESPVAAELRRAG